MARTKAVTYADTTVAIINSTEYATLQLAIDNVANNETVQLIKSTSESITIPVAKNFTLNIGTNTLTNTDGNHTINNKGTVTIIGSGIVDNISNEKAALWNDGTATLTGNTYTRSQETGIDDNESGGNSYYTIVNHGTMTINDGTTVTQNGKFSSLVENGWYNGSQNTEKQDSVLMIEGGSFTGGLNTIKNDDYGKLVINGGTFTNVAQAALLNWNEATVNNGLFVVDSTSNSIVINGHLDEEMDKGVLNIVGGEFKYDSIKKSSAPNGISVHSTASTCGNIDISGGTINGNINLDFGTTTGGTLSVSSDAIINGSILNTKSDSVEVSGGTIANGISNTGTGTINVSGGNISGGVKNTGEGTVSISGGTFTNIPDGESIEDFLTDDSTASIKYTVTVNNGTGSGEYSFGDTVTCSATIPEGKKLLSWSVSGVEIDNLTQQTITFQMPKNNVTCTANYTTITPIPENSWYFTVTQEGTSLNGLALRFNIPIKKLMADNNITEYRPLYVGEQILIIDDGKEKAVNSTTCWIP